MIKILVTKSLQKEIDKRLPKKKADDVYKQIYALRDNPHKGDTLTIVGSMLLKELKMHSFRFYFIHSKEIFKLVTEDELKTYFIKFISMSKKKDQQKIINSIKKDLKDRGFSRFI